MVDGDVICANAADGGGRYSSAHYEYGARWQCKKTVTQNRLIELLSSRPMLKSSCCLSMREARYLINSKVMPDVLYPA